MTTVLRLGALRFVVYVDDHPPPLVHVEGKGGEAKIALDGPTLMRNRGFALADMKSALGAVSSE